jgi:hypothetical protein
MRCCALPTMAFVLAFGLGLDTARADAVPPAPDSCPRGQVGVTSHAGPECVPEAPTNCAPGYRGRVGGTCVLAACSNHDNCVAGERCMQVDTCQEFRELHWTGWGWSARRPRPAGNLLGGPPAPPPPGPPKKAWVQLNICGQDGACAEPAQCRPAPLCYPQSAIGKTKAKVTEPGAKAADTQGSAGGGPSGGNVPPEADTVVDPTGYDPPPSDGEGCRKGCTTASTAPEQRWAGLLLVAALIARRRLGTTTRRRASP